jgi:galactokinase
MDIGKLKREFIELYGESGHDILVFFAPGRVNLIGEHTDYNKGYVLPVAISLGTCLLVRKTQGNELCMASANFDHKARIPLDKLHIKKDRHWVNYPLGVIVEFNKKMMAIGGLEMYFSGNIPAGAGLSSSASIELVTAVAINHLYDFGIDMPGLIRMSVRAEREFVGVQCGIMDQFIVGKGRKNAALFLNCGTEQYVHVPFPAHRYSIVIADTGKIRRLSESKYNERVSECRQGLAAIATTRHISSLAELSIETFEQVSHVIPDPVVRKRVRHVVSENRRVLEAVKALMNKEVETFGRLMDQSHESLRHDYEVTGPELDAMVDISREQKGVMGARMTGAGFGGCAIALIENDCINGYVERVGAAYRERTGLDPAFYIPGIAAGAAIIKEP